MQHGHIRARTRVFVGQPAEGKKESNQASEDREGREDVIEVQISEDEETATQRSDSATMSLSRKELRLAEQERKAREAAILKERRHKVSELKKMKALKKKEAKRLAEAERRLAKEELKTKLKIEELELKKHRHEAEREIAVLRRKEKEAKAAAEEEMRREKAMAREVRKENRTIVRESDKEEKQLAKDLKQQRKTDSKWKRKYASARMGYLADGHPRVPRFSDESEVSRRPPSPALPEFAMMSNEYVPYVIESPLPEDMLNDPSILSEIVIELEPHRIVSGMIDTRVTVPEEKVEHFELDENRTTVLRPEEILIFFETDSGGNRETNAVIPFSPATPANTTIESSATFKKE